jgi:hypothetical protein
MVWNLAWKYSLQREIFLRKYWSGGLIYNNNTLQVVKILVEHGKVWRPYYNADLILGSNQRRR